MKRYAAPGIDSQPGETGVFNSGAGLSPERDNFGKQGIPPDWSSANPVWGLQTGRFIGNKPETQAPPISSIRIRRRGISPWGGFNGLDVSSRYGQDSKDSKVNVGGSVDHNAGASAMIAGGTGAASSFVRLHGHQRLNRGNKLPTLPPAAVREGNAGAPSGGVTGAIPAPLVPQMFGLPSINKVSPYPGYGNVLPTSLDRLHPKKGG